MLVPYASDRIAWVLAGQLSMTLPDPIEVDLDSERHGHRGNEPQPR